MLSTLRVEMAQFSFSVEVEFHQPQQEELQEKNEKQDNQEKQRNKRER